jgi:hypothetical protein
MYVNVTIEGRSFYLNQYVTLANEGQLVVTARLRDALRPWPPA